MLYKLLGRMTWKAIRYYVSKKVPRGAVAAAIVLVGIAVLSAAAKLRDSSSS